MKNIVATRIKKKNHSKSWSIFMGIFGMIGIIFGLVCVVNPMKEESMPILGIILIVMGALMGITILAVVKAGKRIDKTNSYPEQAVVIEDDILYILTDKLTKIPLNEIKRVWCSREQTVGVFFRVIKTSGTLQIKTQNQTYTLSQIANVVDAKQKIKSFLKK